MAAASSSRQRRLIYRLRYDVYVTEEGKSLRHANHARRTLRDEHDRTAHHLIVEDADGAVACVRLHIGRIPPALAAPLQLGRFPHLANVPVCLVSKLMVRRDARRSRVTIELLRAVYETARAAGVGAIFCTTFPHLVSLYERIGFSAYGGRYDDRHFGPHYALVADCDAASTSWLRWLRASDATLPASGPATGGVRCH